MEKQMETKQHTMVNGVDVTAFAETMAAIKEQPMLAQFKFRSTNKWLDGAHNRSSIQGFYGAGREEMSREVPFTWDNAEPPILLGHNRGGNPVEFVLHALAGCMTTTMVYYAAAEGVEINAIESSFEGDIDLHGMLGLKKDVRPGYQQLRVSFKIDADTTEEMKDRLIELAMNHSPVFSTLSMPVPIDVKRIAG